MMAAIASAIFQGEWAVSLKKVLQPFNCFKIASSQLQSRSADIRLGRCPGTIGRSLQYFTTYDIKLNEHRFILRDGLGLTS